MGREAYLNRVVLGRSAFETPLRDGDDNFILGKHVRDCDDRSYEQQWNERGRPHNPESERRSKIFRQAQNEVLHACGVIISKDRAKVENCKPVHHSTRLAEIEEENNIGFFFKGIDRVNGVISTWWLQSLRKQLMVFGLTHSSFTQMIRYSFSMSPSTDPADFVYAGLPTGLTAGFARIVRQCETEETGIEPINFLEVRWDEPPFSEEKLRLWGAWILFMSVEIPFEFVSVLQSLGFSILPAIVDYIRQWPLSRPLSSFSLLNPAYTALLQTILAYLLRDRTHFQLKRRMYQLIGQLLIRPVRPSQICVDAADADDMVDATSILGLGRSLGTYTDRRFLGPLSLRKALPIAFPWLSMIISPLFDRDALKKETLTRCLLTEDIDESRRLSHSQRSHIRARNILSNLESLNVDVEEDFFVDMDSWTMELDSITFTDMQRQRNEMSPIFIMADDPIPSTETDEPNDESSEPRAEENNQTPPEMRPPIESALDRPEETNEFRFIEAIPSTPEPRLRRAPSLAQSARLPVRRPTETIDPDFDYNLALVLAEASRQRADKARQKPKDPREFNITRLSVFAADSLAWHASSILTGLIMIPLDAIFIRSLVGWYTSVSPNLGRTTSVSYERGTFSMGSIFTNPWRLLSTLVLSFGAECLVRGALWQLGSRVALHYNRKITPRDSLSDDTIDD